MATGFRSTWETYSQPSSPARSPSIPSSHDAGEDQSLLHHGADSPPEDSPTGSSRRRSSLTTKLGALTDIGGVNSIRAFARSWQRAAGFVEVIPQRPPLIFSPDVAPAAASEPRADVFQYFRGFVEAAPPVRTSLLRQHLEAYPDGPEASSSRPLPEASAPTNTEATKGDFRERERTALDAELAWAFHGDSQASPSSRQSIFDITPHLAAASRIGSYASYRSYGTAQTHHGLPSLPTDWQRDQMDADAVAEDEVLPMLVKEVEQDGKIVLAVEGQSTLPQTVFNSINVLIGVGLLSLPLGIKYAGWICGISVLTSCAAVTAYTAKLLAKCLQAHPSLVTFSDLAYICFGRNARVATSLLFTLELLAACVALVILFADSLDLLIPGFLSVTQWKVVCSLILLPLNFLPLRLLSFTSVVGILSCFSIVAIVVFGGLIKAESPGSLLDPAATYLFPARWTTLPLSFGLLLSPWGGHSVFPNIYRDMRHPHRYGEALKASFVFTYLLDVTTAVAGILMFGDDVADEITSNILKTTGYPRAITFLLCIFIAIIPLTKIPLNARPIISTLEVISGVHQHPYLPVQPATNPSSTTYHAVTRLLIRIFTVFAFLAISILFPAFDSIMAFMGSALCFQICVVLPLAFYLKLFGHEISATEKMVDWILIVLCSVLSIVGTVWSFLPKSLVGAE